MNSIITALALVASAAQAALTQAEITDHITA